MADTGNILFDVSTKVGTEIFKAKKQALKATPVEFSYKKGNIQDWRNAGKTNESFRPQQLDKLGVDGFLDKWGGRRNGTEQ